MDSCGLTAFVACSLNKCLGIRPNGIGEVVQLVLGKTTLATISDEEVVGTLQACAEQQAGCKAAVHVVREDPMNEAVLCSSGC